MSAWYDDLREFEYALRGHGEMASALCLNYPIAVALEIYRNNCRGNLQGALALAYPICRQLVGEEFFRMTSIRFIGIHPSKSGNLHDYGAEFGEFLNSFAPARALPYLADMAKLEWACHGAYFAADEESLDVAALMQVAPESRNDLRFLLHPACRIVKSGFPVVSIWQAHQPGMPADFHVDLDIGPQNALVSRKGNAVRVSELSDAEAQWLGKIREGVPIGTATAIVLEKQPDFDLQSLLVDSVSWEILIDFEPGPGGKS